MQVDAIVPAYNEAATIGDVVAALVASRVFARVLVVDDGSRDDTVAIARRAGAEVLVLPTNCGKGGAMLAGVRATTAPAVAFFDADLIGLRPDHAQRLVAPMDRGAVMSVGLRDYGNVYNKLQAELPPITGERVVLRRILERVPPTFWRGFRIEAGINEAARRDGGEIAKTVLYHMTMRPKWHKTSVEKGVVDGVNMLVEVLCAMRDARTM